MFFLVSSTLFSLRFHGWARAKHLNVILETFHPWVSAANNVVLSTWMRLSIPNQLNDWQFWSSVLPYEHRWSSFVLCTFPTRWTWNKVPSAFVQWICIDERGSKQLQNILRMSLYLGWSMRARIPGVIDWNRSLGLGSSIRPLARRWSSARKVDGNKRQQPFHEARKVPDGLLHIGHATWASCLFGLSDSKPELPLGRGIVSLTPNHWTITNYFLNKDSAIHTKYWDKGISIPTMVLI